MFMYIQYGSNATLSFLWKLENLLKICSINIPTASNSHLLQLYFPLYSLLSYSIGGANNMFPPPTKVLKASLANQSYYSHPTHQQKINSTWFFHLLRSTSILNIIFQKIILSPDVFSNKIHDFPLLTDLIQNWKLELIAI